MLYEVITKSRLTKSLLHDRISLSLAICFNPSPSKTMNILVVSTFSPEKSVGGIERYLLNFIAYSKKYSHDHTYFLLPTSDNKTLLDGPNTSILRHHSLTLKATKIFGERKVSSITAEKQAKEFYSYLNQTRNNFV